MAEQLTIDTFEINRDGFSKVRDLATLLDFEVRGSDVVIPGVDGVLPKRRRLDVTTTFLELMIFGQKAYDGTPHADTRAGVYANLDEIISMYMEPTGTGDGTRAAVLTVGSTSWGADVHTLPPLNARSVANGMLRGVLRISIPSGRFLVIP